MPERRRTTQLAGRNPSIRLTPLPTGDGNTLQPFPEIRCGHGINVNADVLSEEAREGLETAASEIAVRVFKRSNDQGKADNEAHRRLRMAVYESGHVVKLGLAKKQHVAASGEKSVNAAKQSRDVWRRFVGRGRCSREAEKTSGRRVGFTQFIPNLCATGPNAPSKSRKSSLKPSKSHSTRAR